MKGYYKYFGKKLFWFVITFIAAFLLNFILPRLMPGDPVAAITARVVQGIQSQDAIQQIYNQYAEQFGTNKPMLEQLILYVKNMARVILAPRSANIPDRLQTFSELPSCGQYLCKDRRSSSAG